jgi:hypothetical protein
MLVHFGGAVIISRRHPTGEAMQQYNKLTGAILAGAVLTIISAAIDAYFPDFSHRMWTPQVQAAVQTLVTALTVYLSPPNAMAPATTTA